MRFYDPILGRWLTPDPSGFADGPNLYVYVLNSPLNRLDLFGLDSDPRLPQEMRYDTPPLCKIWTPPIIPSSKIIHCKGSISGVPVDWVVSCGHWDKLKFTPQEKAIGMVNIVDHFEELIPKEGKTVGLITMQNGICTTKKDLKNNVASIAEMVPEGTLTIGMYNPTKGMYSDCKRTFKEQAGKDTPVVVHTRQIMVAISDSLYKINPTLLWLHILHSEGGVIGCNAIKGMTEDQKDRLKNQLHLLALGPAKPIPNKYGREVTNVYSKKDYITGRFASKYKNDSEYNIRMVPCRSKTSQKTAFFADHAYLGKTYQAEQLWYITDLRKQNGFYDCKNH